MVKVEILDTAGVGSKKRRFFYNGSVSTILKRVVARDQVKYFHHKISAASVDKLLSP